MAKIIFFQPHPDDLELFCGHIMHYLAKKSKKKHILKIASLTKGEFGLPGPEYDKFKGELLARVRTHELFAAQSMHEIPPENITFFDYIDGFVPFDREIINKVTDYLRIESPDVIFAPEPIYTGYYHMDHINCGRVVYYIIHKGLIEDFTPNLFFYTSLCPNYFFGFDEKEFDLTYQLLACHKTQNWFFNNLKMILKPQMRYYGTKIHGWKYAEAFRRVYFTKKNLEKNRPSFVPRVFSHFFSSLPWYNAKYPAHLLEKVTAMERARRNVSL